MNVDLTQLPPSHKDTAYYMSNSSQMVSNAMDCHTYIAEVLDIEQPSGNICNFVFKVEGCKNPYVIAIVKSCILVAKGVGLSLILFSLIVPLGL